MYVIYSHWIIQFYLSVPYMRLHQTIYQSLNRDTVLNASIILLVQAWIWENRTSNSLYSRTKTSISIYEPTTSE